MMVFTFTLSFVLFQQLCEDCVHLCEDLLHQAGLVRLCVTHSSTNTSSWGTLREALLDSTGNILQRCFRFPGKRQQYTTQLCEYSNNLCTKLLLHTINMIWIYWNKVQQQITPFNNAVSHEVYQYLLVEPITDMGKSDHIETELAFSFNCLCDLSW